MTAEPHCSRICNLSLSYPNETTTQVATKVTDKCTDKTVFMTHQTGLLGEKNYNSGQETRAFNGVTDTRFVDPHFSALKAPLHRLYTRVVEQGLQENAKAIVGSLISGVENLQILTDGDLPVLYLVFNGYALPAALAGDGIRLLLQIALELVTRQGGLVLLEEVALSRTQIKDDLR